MPAFTTTQDRYTITVATAEIELAFSRDDGGLRVLRRHDGPNLLGYGAPIPAINVQVGIEEVWLAERVFVRYLSHSVDEREGAVELVIVIGVGPLMLYDRYRITGTMIARRISVKNVSEDEILLRRVRMALPWVRIGDPDTCRFDAPGNSARPHVPLRVAAALRRGVLPRQFFTAGLREGRALELAPIQAAGLMALYDQHHGNALLCWFYSEVEPAQPTLEGNDQAVTLIHDLELADRLRSEVVLSGGTQYILLLHEPWPAALAAFQRTQALFSTRPALPPAPWLRDANIYETHPAEQGGFCGLAARLSSLQRLGFTVVCMLPIWKFDAQSDLLWDGNWIDSGNPFAIHDFEQLDPTLGSPDDLRALVRRAHDLGMRVVVDLPLGGCAADARYVREHPEWLCYDAVGDPIAVPGSPNLLCFDWSNTDLQQYVLEQAAGQARDYGFDGYRVFPPRRAIPNWTRRLAHHASAGMLGALHLIDQLRAALRASNPEAALISSRAGPAYTGVTDAAVDELPHHQFLHMVMDRVSPAELGDWLDSHTAILPGEALRICFTESHTTRLINPLADGLRGSRLSRLALLGLVLCGFVPMIPAGQEEADEEFIGRLLRARRNYPALRHGRTLYGKVTSNSRQIFGVLRQSSGQQVIGLLNVGPHTQTVQVHLPLDSMDLPEGSYALEELLQGESSTAAHTVKPFTGYCFLLRKVEVAADDLPADVPADTLDEPLKLSAPVGR
jgi:hypothetical protein